MGSEPTECAIVIARQAALAAGRGMIEGVSARAAALSRRARRWAERQDPASASGVAIGAWRRYRAVDGPLQSALLSLYVLVAVLPALLVIEECLDPHPNALAHHLAHHFGLNAATSELLQSVLVEGHAHELGSALLAIASALFFGLGFGRVLQLVHTRAWRLELPRKQTDQAICICLGWPIWAILLLLVQLTELKGAPLGGFGACARLGGTPGRVF